MSLPLVEQLQQKAVPDNLVCCVLEVSRSGYYTARKRAFAQPVRGQCAFEGRVCIQWRGTELSYAHGHGFARARDCPPPHAGADAQPSIALGMEAEFRAQRLQQTLPISPNVMNVQFNTTRRKRLAKSH